MTQAHHEATGPFGVRSGFCRPPVTELVRAGGAFRRRWGAPGCVCAERGRGCQETAQGPAETRTGMEVSSREVKINSSAARGGSGRRGWALGCVRPRRTFSGQPPSAPRRGSRRARLISSQDPF